MMVATQGAGGCGRCGGHLSAGPPVRANGAHVVCPPRRARRPVVVDVAPVLQHPVVVGCGCADLRVEACTCAFVTRCAEHGEVHHGTHD